MKFSIYYFEGDLKNEDFRRVLVLEAVSEYCRGRGIPFDADMATVMKGEKGKPYVEGLPVHFNVSHTGKMWLCIVGPEPCGLDLQQEKDCDYMAIGRKHFTSGEQKYMEAMGQPGFFQLWTRREAYGKYTGQGFYGEMPPFADEEGVLLEETGGAYLREIPIADDIFCTYCTGGKDDEIEFFG